jgi:hypothetical protein
MKSLEEVTSRCDETKSIILPCYLDSSQKYLSYNFSDFFGSAHSLRLEIDDFYAVCRSHHKKFIFVGILESILYALRDNSINIINF